MCVPLSRSGVFLREGGRDAGGGAYVRACVREQASAGVEMLTRW